MTCNLSLALTFLDMLFSPFDPLGAERHRDDCPGPSELLVIEVDGALPESLPLCVEDVGLAVIDAAQVLHPKVNHITVVRVGGNVAQVKGQFRVTAAAKKLGQITGSYDFFLLRIP